MSRRAKVLEVGVSRRILWIGSAAYPLHNIARAQTIEIAPDRGRAVRHYVAQMLVWLVLGVGAFAALNGADLSSDSDAADLRTLAWGVLLLLIAISTVRVLTALMARTYYAMVIETAGSPQTALISTDKREVSSLVRQTMAAIDDPAAEFHYQVNNITKIGEQYNLSGKYSVGKQVSA
jgi:uncharacterized protein DUF6232